MPPQLRWFMRTTFMPAAKPFRAIPSMYCDSLDPSSPCTTISVSALPVLLPVTVAQHRNARFHFDQALFGGRQVDSAREKESSERLHMPAAQPATWPEDGGRKRRRLLRQAVLELSS